WTGDPASLVAPTAPAPVPAQAPLTYTPEHLVDKILASRAVLEGERKQVTVLFADLKSSTELIEGLDPEDARQLLDPALHVMMDAVHRYEGTVKQVLGDGIMALFGAPVAHEDHAVRACYASLAMQEGIRRYAEEVRRSHGLEMQARVGHEPSLAPLTQLLIARTQGKPSFWKRACALWWRPGAWSGSGVPIAWRRPCRRFRSQPRCRQCWPPASTVCRPRTSAASRRRRSSAPRCPCPCCRPLPRSPQRWCSAAWSTCRPRSFSTKRGSFR